MDQAKVGKFIAKLRKLKKLTQIELADKLGLTDKAVSKWECGLGCPDISLLIPLSEILETSIYELLIGESMTKVPIDKVDEALKTTINVATKEKQKNLKYKIILIISLIVIFLEILVVGYFALDKHITANQHKYPKPEKVNINIIEDYYKFLKDQDCEIDILDDGCEVRDEPGYPYYQTNPIPVLASKLPMYLYKVEGNFRYPRYELNPEFRIYNNYREPEIIEEQEIIYNFINHTEEEMDKEYEVKNFTKKSMIVNSIVLFNYAQNLEKIKFIFKDQIYVINKVDVESIYKDKYVEISALKQKDNWEKYVINKLKDKNYIDLILDNIIEK